MVSFWPFGKREDNSPDSFERTLAKLTSQIQAETSKLAAFRQNLRRYKGLFTIYTFVAYISYVVFVFLVVGWNQIRPLEIGGLVGGPVGIWSIRKLLVLYYNSRISATETRLEDLQAEQKDTVEKFKEVMKFSTTQYILEKYGGGSVSSDAEKEAQQQQQQQQQQGGPQGPHGPHGHPNSQLKQRLKGESSRVPPPVPTTPQEIQQQQVQQQLMAQQQAVARPATNNPNPVQKSNPPAPIPILDLPQTTTQPASQQHIQPEEPISPRWFDRVLDVLVGEDETSPNNRYALICKNCRMVNGLAPPGTKNPEDMEGWGCTRCGMMNGRPPSRSPSQPLSTRGEEGELDIAPNLEVKKSRSSKSRSPTPSENVRTTRSKAKKVVEVKPESSSEEDSEDDGSEEEEEIPEPPKPRSKGKATKGSKRA